MVGKGRIITIGINPAWDIDCLVDGIEWGEHKKIEAQTSSPAGKALNVSKSLSYLGYISTAMGLWGDYDYGDMINELRPLSAFIDIRFTVVNGRTRRNVCISDTRNNRQMHLRLSGTLATRANIKKLCEQLERFFEKDDICVFAGSIPEGSFAEDIISLFWNCRQKGASIILDSSGKMFYRLVDTGQVWAVSPNLQELEGLLGCRVKPEPHSVAKAGRKLLDRVEYVIVSLSAAGAMLIGKDGYWQTELKGIPLPVVRTVGCGDNLLAGFIAGRLEDDDPAYALTKGVRLATAYAYGLCETTEAWQLEEKIGVQTTFHSH